MASDTADEPGPRVTDRDELVIRRAYRKKSEPLIQDQVTGRFRLPAKAFEPRLPQNRPRATRFDRYLSVNIASSLRAAGLPLNWGCDDTKFIAGSLAVGSIDALGLRVTAEPVWIPEAGQPINPHHGAIWGVVEIYGSDEYDNMLDALVNASTILPECLPDNR
jgi:hypothetical protein